MTVAAAMFGSVHALGAVAVLAVAAPASASEPLLVRSSLPTTDALFGQVIATRAEGDLVELVAAAPSLDGARGFVQLVTIEGQQLTVSASLRPADLAPNERFGYSVAISSTAIAAGSPFGSAAPGKVRVFPRTASGIGSAVLIGSPDPAVSDAFGHAVATWGDWLAVGEPLDDSSGTAQDRGAVHLFRRSADGAWHAHARIVSPDAVAGDTFGYTLTMDAATLVVASRFADVGSMQQAGAVWTVDLGTSGSVGAPVRVQAPDPGAYEWFGASVAIEGNTLVVGACRDTISAQVSEQGTTRVFRRTEAGWSQQAMLVSPGAATQDRFGNSVAIDHGRILVGADGQDPAAVSLAGRLHLYVETPTGWAHDRAFELDPGTTNQNLGVACSLHDRLIVGGAPRHTPPAGVMREGAVGVWQLDAPCPADFDQDGSISGPDLGVLLSQWGLPGSSDLNSDGVVDAADLGFMLAGWGPCAP